MSETQAVATTQTALVTGVVASGENLFKAITGKEMTESQQKVSDGLTSMADGIFPAISSRVSFDLGGVVSGATEVINGLALTVNSAKAKVATETDSTGTGAVSAAS